MRIVMIIDQRITYGRKFLLSLLVALLSIALNAQNDTAMKSKKFTSIVDPGAGYISAGYSYGLTPFTMIDSAVGGYFIVEGNQLFSVKNAPINISGRYTTLKNVSGLNNNVRVSFDANTYKEQLKQRAKAKALSYKDSILNVRNLEQQYTKRLYYLQYLNSLPADQYNNKVARPAINDSLNIHSSDSLTALPSILKNELPELSLPQGEGYKEELNTIITQQRHVLDSIRNLRTQFQLLQSKADSIAALKSGEINPDISSKLSAIRALEVGLCYPMHSPLSLYGIPLRGVNAEFETQKVYFSVAAGRTISNLLFTNDLLQHNLNNVQNLYNFFDFNNAVAGRTIAAVRLGAGAKDKSHVHVGFLWGRGLESYWQDSTHVLNTSALEQNLVADIDVSFTFAKNHSINVNFAKSVLNNLNGSPEDDQAQQVKLTDFNYRSHAA